MKRIVGGSLLLSMCVTPMAQASIELIADGTVSGHFEDLSAETSAPLENGVAGNRLGGLGSGLAYAGGTTFISVPDRGPNAKAYNSAVDDTTSYINRFQTLNLTLSPNESAVGLPFVLTPTLRATTLLSSKTPLIYSNGAAAGLGSGAPALNSKNRTNYLVGRSDNFDPTQTSTNSRNGRFDPEGVRVSADGGSVFITDEYGPYVYQFHRASGLRLRAYTLPAKFAVSNLLPKGDPEIAGNTSGRVANKGMEGLAISPNGKYLFGMMQSPLIQDGGVDAPYTRIVRINIATGAINEYAYPLSNIGTDAKPKYPTVSEILAINDHEFLVDERDGKGFGDNSKAVVKKIYRIHLANAQDVSAVTGASNLAAKAVQKTLFLDLVAALNANGFASADIPAKIEGMAFGPDVVVDGVTQHTLYIANDNDFIGTIIDSGHPLGAENPNHFFVFAFSDSDLPGLQPQRLVTLEIDTCVDIGGTLLQLIGNNATSR